MLRNAGRGRARSARRPGFSLVELLIIMVVVVVAFVCWVAYYNNRRVGTCGNRLTCSTRLNQVHKGMDLFANDFGGGYPRPAEISPETAAIGAQTGNSSANFYSYMIWNTYYSPEIAVCPDELNRNIVVDTDFRYGNDDDPGWKQEWQWDPAFSCDFVNGTGNASYALLAPVGQRVKDQWRASLDSNYIVASDRGPRDGVFDANSLANVHRSSSTAWAGNFAFNDGHVKSMTFGKKDPQAFTFNGDNLFFPEGGTGGSDIWLGVWGDTDETMTTPFWD